MASNQAVDSREVTAFPRRGRWLWLAPGALPTHCPCHVPAGRALLTLKKFPDTASEMGIDTGLLVHGCSRTCPWQSCAVARAHGVCPWEGTGQGLGASMVTSTGTALSLEHKEQLYSQSIPCPWSQGSTDSPAQPVSLMGTHKDLMHLPDVPGYDLGP